MIIWNEETTPEKRVEIMHKLWSKEGIIIKARYLQEVYGECILTINENEIFELYYIDSNGKLKKEEF